MYGVVFGGLSKECSISAHFLPLSLAVVAEQQLASRKGNSFNQSYFGVLFFTIFETNSLLIAKISEIRYHYEQCHLWGVLRRLRRNRYV